MIERLASLADRRAKRVLIVAALFFVVAGAFGAGVADRLAPYSADDPATESVTAEQQLEHAGYRETDVVVLADGVDPRTAAGRERIAGLSRELRHDGAVASTSSFIDTGSNAFVSRDGG